MGQGDVSNTMSEERGVVHFWSSKVDNGIVGGLPTTCGGTKVAGRTVATPAARSTKLLPVNEVGTFCALVKQG